MSLKTRGSRYPKAEEFLFSMASSVPGWSQVTSTDDVEGIARRLSQYVASKLAAEDIDSILEVLDEALRREAGSAPKRSKTRSGKRARPNLADSYQKPDPYFWG